MTKTIALLEVLDRDGQVRHQLKIAHWPLRLGRALDNDCVLDDLHLAPYHLTFNENESGIYVQAGDTLNGVIVAGKHLLSGQSVTLSNPVVMLYAGLSILRLRRLGEKLAPELLIEARPQLLRGPLFLWGTVLALACIVGFYEWTQSPPGDWFRNYGQSLLMILSALLGWSGIWALVSKVIMRRSYFGWHARVALWAALGCALALMVASWLAFVLSWPRLSSFSFVGPYLVVAYAMAFHLSKVALQSLQVRLKIVGLIFCITLGLHLELNQASYARWGRDLYMTQLFPAHMRLVRAKSLKEFMEEVNHLHQDIENELAKEL